MCPFFSAFGTTSSTRALAASLPLVPREFAVVVLSAAAVHMHATQAADATEYRGEVSFDAVFKELQFHYAAGTGRTGSLREQDVRDLLLTKLYCRPATGWTGSADSGRPGMWLPRALALYESSYASASANPACSRG